MPSLRNVLRLCGKELTSLLRDRVLFVFMLYAFSLMVYAQATGTSHDLVRASLGVVDEDRSALSQRIIDGFLPPRFQKPAMVSPDAVDHAMDQARYTFVLNIPPDFQADVLAGRHPDVQLLIDATAVMQAGIGANYIQSIVSDEIGRFLRRDAAATPDSVELRLRIAFNQTLESTWFTGAMALLQVINMLAILLTGAAVMREREHGTLEHLLVMPVRASEIMLAKIIANGGVILCLSLISLYVVLEAVLGMQIAGSLSLFFAATAIYLFFAAALGIVLATFAGSMAQFALLFILVQMPMYMLSGALTPLEAMPGWLQTAVQLLPTKHYVAVTQAILSRGAGLETVWPEFLTVFAMGAAAFAVSLLRFRRFLSLQQ
ncbi:MAG: ABC transporter permease [Ferrovibrio sp.]|uniref:ABC transporter permease n=1 Tax=Ferrovibrio sp. TaxID=1917215 RepID=UPI002622AEBA|nr:ABC transporter permease [Ferrovibrio sp.]MCW0233106.1 ABC transporter permease [Ferrovibrio sp.]